ncbi:MAG: TonB-dependent receptor, partial [Acidobacteriota bacterium]|nr:TonB-dependent receptor [Acidobacteriota bacterium]
MSILFLFAAGAWAQGTGTLTGTVVDPGGSLVPKANVTLTNEATHVASDTVTTEAGVFTVPELPNGTYDVKVSAPGFKEFVQTGVTVNVGNTSTVNIGLQLGGTSEVVTIHADAQQIQSETSDIGTSIDSRLNLDLPLPLSNQVRSPLNFVTLTPGFSGTVANDPTTHGQFKVNGGQQDGADVLIDGVSIEYASPNVQQNYGVSAEAVSEFRVLTGTFPAEYGRTSGGLVDLVVKSGANQLHGTAYEILRNSVLDSAGWINNYTGAGRPIDRQNDFGGQLSGPIRIPKLYNGKDRTFFMFNYEGYRYSNSSATYNTLPLPAFQQGDFSALLRPETRFGQTFVPHQLYNPNNGAPYPGNIIPMSQADPVTQKMMKYLPVAQTNDVIANFFNTTVNTVGADIYTAKVDESISEKQKISAMYSHDARPRLTTQSLGENFTSIWASQWSDYARLAYDYTISPNIVNHADVGFSRRYRTEDNGEATYNKDWKSLLGLNTGQQNTMFPSLSLDAWGPNTSVGPNPTISNFADNDFQYDDSLNWVKGAHSLKFGFDIRRQQFNTERGQHTGGAYGFGQQNTGTPGDPNSGLSYATFFLGNLSGPSAEDTELGRAIGLRARYYGMYAQDDWKVNRKLTLNLGFRYEIPQPTVEAHNRLSWLNETLPNPGAGNLPGAYEYAGYGPGLCNCTGPEKTYYHSFGPRIGLAYQVDEKTVVRAGYGIYYDALKISGFADADSFGFFGGYTAPYGGNPYATIFQISKINGYQGTYPPFTNPAGYNGQSPNVVQTDTAYPGKTMNWTVDIQRQLANNLMLDVAYVGAHGDHLQAATQDPNQLNPKYLSYGNCLLVNITQQATNSACAGQAPVSAPFPGFTGTVAQALRPFPQYTGGSQLDGSLSAMPWGFYSYEALQTKLQKRFSNGLSMLASYTWSKNLTNADSQYPYQASWSAGNGNFAQNSYNSKAEKALSYLDIPQSFLVSYVYELPVGKGKKFLDKGGLVNAV